MIGELYGDCLHTGHETWVEYDDGGRSVLPVDRWLSLRPGDDALLDRCIGPTLDVGCGPGRFVTELAARGHVALGIDVTPAAVDLAARAGGSVLLRDVFDPVPGTGRWQTVLLADGNIGIGGSPATLLGRVASLMARTGRVLVETGGPGGGLRRLRARLHTGDKRSAWFDWATVGVDALPDLADQADLRVDDAWTEDDRWLATLARG